MQGSKGETLTDPPFLYPLLGVVGMGSVALRKGGAEKEGSVFFRDRKTLDGFHNMLYHFNVCTSYYTIKWIQQFRASRSCFPSP